MVRHSMVLGVGTLVLVMGFAPSAFAMDASTKEAVRTLTNDGATDLDAGRYDAALSKFERAFATAPVPTIGLLLARTHTKLGHLVQALETYRQVTVLAKNELWVENTQQTAQAQAQTELVALQPRIPQLTVLIEGANATDVEVTVDNVAVPKTMVGLGRPVDPGKHRVVGKLGAQVVEQVVELVEHSSKDIALKFASQPVAPIAPAPAPALQPAPAAAVTPSSDSTTSSQRTWGWVSLGVGAAGIGVGTVVGLLVASKYNDLKDQCGGDDCGPSYWSDVDSYNSLRTVSTIGFIVGGIGTAAGVTLLLTSPKEESSPRVGVTLSPAAAMLKGSF